MLTDSDLKPYVRVEKGGKLEKRPGMWKRKGRNFKLPLVLVALILLLIPVVSNLKHTEASVIPRSNLVFAPRTEYIRDVLDSASVTCTASTVNFSQNSPYGVVTTPGTYGFEDEVVKRNIVIEKAIKQVSDPSLEKGKTKVIDKGRNGEVLQTVVLHKENGQVVNETVVSEVKLVEVEDQVVAIGTKDPVRTVLTSRGSVPYKKVLTMVSTAYEASEVSCGEWADGYTAIGMKAEPGVVAVDPNVIPLRTKLYVEGYGFAIAADVGGDIKGNRIDLFFNTIDECMNYGRKKVKVYIL